MLVTALSSSVTECIPGSSSNVIERRNTEMHSVLAFIQNQQGFNGCKGDKSVINNAPVNSPEGEYTEEGSTTSYRIKKINGRSYLVDKNGIIVCGPMDD